MAGHSDGGGGEAAKGGGGEAAQGGGGEAADGGGGQAAGCSSPGDCPPPSTATGAFVCRTNSKVNHVLAASNVRATTVRTVFAAMRRVRGCARPAKEP